RRKVRMIREGLESEGFAPESTARIHAPIGLDIGARTPEEIALAIAAELVCVRRRGSAAHLRPG
ncbi:MAG: XdhC family protein, partial [Armatimonadota bacterium]